MYGAGANSITSSFSTFLSTKDLWALKPHAPQVVLAGTTCIEGDRYDDLCDSRQFAYSVHIEWLIAYSIVSCNYIN